MLTPMAADLVARNVDLICAQSSAAVQAARAVAGSIPIVAADLESDPVAEGFIASHARPGGNITGVFLDFPDFSKKWLEALKEAVPQLMTVTVLWDPAVGPYQLKSVETAAQTFGLMLVVQEVRRSDELRACVPFDCSEGCGRRCNAAVDDNWQCHEIAGRPCAQAPAAGYHSVRRFRPEWRFDGLWT